MTDHEDWIFLWKMFDESTEDAGKYLARRQQVFAALGEKDALEALDIIKRLSNRLWRYAYNDIDAERGANAKKLVERADAFRKALEDEQNENE